MAYAAIFLIVVVLVSVSADVTMRKLLNNPIDWAQEVTEYSIALLTFLGAAWVLKAEGHVSIDVALGWLKPRSGALLNSITSFSAAIICLVITLFSLTNAWSYYQQGIRFVTAYTPVQAPFLAFIPLGFLMLTVQFLRRSFRFFMRWKSAGEEEVHVIKKEAL